MFSGLKSIKLTDKIQDLRALYLRHENPGCHIVRATTCDMIGTLAHKNHL